MHFSSTNWIFFIIGALISQWYTVKKLIFDFWTSSINVWAFLGRSGIFFFTVIFFDNIFFEFFLYFIIFYVGTQKWVTTKSTMSFMLMFFFRLSAPSIQVALINLVVASSRVPSIDRWDYQWVLLRIRGLETKTLLKQNKLLTTWTNPHWSSCWCLFATCIVLFNMKSNAMNCRDQKTNPKMLDM